MAPARHVIVAGAGIAGLTAALALARAGMRVTVFEQAEKLEETGAGLQLSPNASRVLIALGLRERLASVAVAPQAIRVMAGGSAREIVRIPLGDEVERRYGAPYWSIHRGDLQSALADAARNERDVALKLGVRVEDFAAHVNGVSVAGQTRHAGARRARHRADRCRRHLVERRRALAPAASQPTFRHRTAWRALVPADAVPAEFREPFVHLWLGHGRPSRALSGESRPPDQHRRHRSRRVERDRLVGGRRPRRNPAPFRALGLVGEGARAHRHSRSLAEMGAVRPQGTVPRGQATR